MKFIQDQCAQTRGTVYRRVAMGHKRAVVLGVRFGEEMERDARELGLYSVAFPLRAGYYARGYDAVRARLAGEAHVAEKYVDALAKLEDADRAIKEMVGREKGLQAQLKKAEKEIAELQRVGQFDPRPESGGQEASAAS
jgi:hypothetical protein